MSQRGNSEMASPWKPSQESAGPTGKHQIPRFKHQKSSSKHQKSSKSQAPRRRRRGQNRDLELGISLVFGAWFLVFSSWRSSSLRRTKFVSRSDPERGLPGALINPGADQADLFLGQRRILVPFFRRRHFHVLHEVGDVSDPRAFGAVAGDDGRIAAFAAFDRGGQGVDAIFALGLVAAVAFHAGFLEDRFDVLLVSDALFLGSERQFGGIPVRFLLFLFGGGEEYRGETKRGGDEAIDFFSATIRQAIGVHGSIIHVGHFNQRGQRRQRDSSRSGRFERRRHV